ncbi:MAG: DNA repair protein RecN [Dehalococcoidia bacterium]|nr:DNA repair protein RecN [Dehalococcoidia bacterium]MDD5493343.1 DNA repair protein RecN [Dehalococcoidia bacterium]
MLGELHIKNFAVIKDIAIRFAPGMNVISGEEGSGKSLLVDALSLIMGARAPGGLIRSGAASARIEAIFWPPEDIAEKMNGMLEDSGIEPESNGMMLISRDFQDGGKSVSRVNNRAVPLSFLKQMGKYLLDIHGQMEYLSLLDSANQLNLVDAHGGLTEQRKNIKHIIEELRAKEKEIAATDNLEKEGYIELLQYQVEEIDRANLETFNEDEIVEQRDVLRRAEAICGGCLEAYSNLYGDERSASVLLHKTITTLRGLSATDKNLVQYKERLEAMAANIEESAHEMRAYSESIQNSENLLQEIEQRLDSIASLKRKYGGSVKAILAFRDKSLAELESLQNLQERREKLEEERQGLRAGSAKAAEELSLARRKSAAKLVKLVNEELTDLGLNWAKFDVTLTRREDADGLCIAGKCYGFTADGIDRVEFQVATNPGEPMRSMAAIASGGETSRIVLAIKSALKKADPIPTLVFDEIDMGVGGRSADSVGRKLASLAGFHQVLCITHLPQIACFGDAHFRLVKDVEGGRASTKVEMIEGSGRLKELAAMLGSESNGNVMLKGAEALVKSADKWKNEAREPALV